jgi:TPR repeat protein
LFTIKPDNNKAILYYKKARKFKLARASNNLAVLYLNAKLNEKEGKSDITSGIESDNNILAYLEEAKKAGFSQAFYNLGTIFSKGLLSQKDPELALKMFYEGSIKGDYKCKIKFAYELMSQTSIMKEQYDDHYTLAIQWLENVIRKFSRFEAYDQANHSEIDKQERAEALFYLGLFH